MIPVGFPQSIKLKQAVGLLLVFCITSSLKAQDSEFQEVVERLDQMSMAMSQMTYQGTFVYVQDSLVETMRITHVVDQNGIHERLVAQTGTQREVLRDSNSVLWIARDRQTIMSDEVDNRPLVPKVSKKSLQEAADHYSVRINGLEPLAGRMGRKISITPRDHYRYGYKLWLDEPSGLLLRWELFEEDMSPIARLMFTDIEVGPEVDRSELMPRTSMGDFQNESSELPEKQSVTRSEPRWAPVNLPPGFGLVSHRMEDSQATSPFQHLVYSDGIASVSVYVEEIDPEKSPEPGASRHGTTSAYSRQEGDLQITVVGDVPVATVEEMAWAVNASQP